MRRAALYTPDRSRSVSLSLRAFVSGTQFNPVEKLMAYAKYYSPRLDRDLVTRLYHEAKAQRVPMTVLTNRLVTEGLSGSSRKYLLREG